MNFFRESFTEESAEALNKHSPTGDNKVKEHLTHFVGKI